MTQATYVRSLSDLGNAERLADHHGQDLRHVAEWASWLVWDGTRWSRDATQEARRRVYDLADAMAAELALAEDDDHRKAIERNITRVRNESGTRGCLNQASALADVAITSDQLDNDPWLLNTPGGTVDLRTGEVTAHDRRHLITKVTRGVITAENAPPCPTWERFIQDVTGGDDNLADWLQLAVGYSLTGSTREQCMFVLYGMGQNGKSRFLEAVRYALGDYSMSTPMNTLMADDRSGGIPNDVARLRGARYVTAAEVDGDQRLSEALVKRLTGDDKIVARFMRSEFFEFTPEMKIWLAVNHRPTIRGTDDGIWRRMRLVPFTVTIPPEKRDLDLAAKLEAEADGILAWAITGCMNWRDQAGGLGIANSVAEATEQYRREMDIIGRFLTDRTRRAVGHWTAAKQLYEEYRRWAEDEGHKAMSHTRFGSEMRDRGHASEVYGKSRTKHHRDLIITRDNTEGEL